MIELDIQVEDEGARGLLRLSRNTLNSLKIRAGDTVRIEAERSAYARVMPASVDDNAGLTDVWLARNAGLKNENKARVSPVVLEHLQTIVLKVSGGPPPVPDHIKESLFDMALGIGDRLPSENGGVLEVVETVPQGAGIVTDRTVLTFSGPVDRNLGYEGLGGLEDEIAKVHEMIAAPLLRPELFAHLGLDAPRGVLFSGPPGSGKTLLARAVAARTKAAFFHINAPEIVTKHYGESEAALRKTFAAATKASPAIVFIDEIDAIAPSRSSLSGEKQVERRIVAQLLTLMDGLSDRGKVVVMAATNMPEALDPALRRPGRFDREIEFRPPNETGRAEILRVHLAKTPLAEEVDLQALARITHGYVGADLAALSREAAVAALNRAVDTAGGEANVDLEDLKVTQADLLRGFELTSPSALRGDEAKVKPTGWSDVGGLDGAKEELTRSIIWPLRHPDVFEKFQVPPAKGILLSGPPGTGKTLLARALSNEAGMNFILVRPPRLLSQYFGEAERAVADLFARARQTAPTLLFFDELDSIAPKRGSDNSVVDRIVGQLLVEFDGLEANPGLVVLAATNRAAAIDPALTRPGRFDTVVEVPLPDQETRRAILEIHLNTRPLDAEIDLDQLAIETQGCSGAELAALVRTAARASATREIKTGRDGVITLNDLLQAQTGITKSQQLRLSDYVRQELVQ